MHDSRAGRKVYWNGNKFQTRSKQVHNGCLKVDDRDVIFRDLLQHFLAKCLSFASGNPWSEQRWRWRCQDYTESLNTCSLKLLK